MKKLLTLLLATCWQLSTLTPQLSTCSAQTVETDTVDIQNIIEVANQGDAYAQAYLGSLYAFGLYGAPQDYAQAVRWYTLAAEQGHPTAQYNLAVLYVNGQGVKADTLQAQKWYDLAYAQDSTFEPIIVDRPAANDFTFSDKRRGKKGDKISRHDKLQFDKALATYRPKAEAGDPIAQYNLGVLYNEGLGTERNYKEAHKWFTLAAQQGDPDAQNNLGIMYYEGQGVGKNYSLALHWYTLAAEQGHYAAQYNLGIMHEQGIGTPKNRAKAKQWFLRAADQGYEPAKQRLQNL